YPLAIWSASKLVSLVSNRPLPEHALLSAQVANAIAALLLVVPTYLIGRMLFSRNVGFAAALLFQVLPVPARITSDGLSEGVYLFATAVAIMLAVRAVRRPGIAGFLLCGLATGASYLVRPEGLLVAMGPGAVALWLGFRRQWPRDVALARLTALTVGVAFVAVPYMALIGKFSNKPTAPYLLNPTDGPPAIYRGGPGAQRASTGGPLFAEWWNDEEDKGKSQLVWGVQAVLKETSKSANYVIWPLALFGIIALRRRFAVEPGLWVLAVLAACNFALLVYLASRVGYVSERHTVLLTLLACQFAAAGLPLLAAALGQLMPRVERLGVRVTAASILLALVVSALPFALKPMHPNREGHKHAGRWLAANLTPQDAVIDPFCWAEWYSGRTLYRVPHGHNPNPPRNVYVILENGKSPHSRLPTLQGAKELAAQGRVVYHWPENVPVAEATVQVYKLGPDH
ncbi:MAG: glycosyltransferase family 39 protein, partial [Planctomycetia bacterium]|nr:glycosyltransferase family 39 protein [Planctomycetia bacterium]